MYLPKYIITNTVLRNIGIIEACREVIKHAPLLPYYEKKFQNEALIRSVHYGTHIEGNELNLSQAERIVMGQQVIARARDVQEVLNYRRVMEYIGGNPKHEISDWLVLHLHKLTVDRILPIDQCGVYRQTQVVIRNSHNGEIVFRPPVPGGVRAAVDNLIAFINSNSDNDIHPVLKSAIVHYEFVRIHPFVDGNGRVARALSTLILFQEGYDIRKFFSLEEYFDSDTANYYTALQSVVKHDGDLTEWLSYFTQGLSVELTRIKEQVEHVSVDAKLKERLGGKPLLLTDRQLKIVEYIQKTGYLENKSFRSLFPMISEDTVLNELRVLIKEGIVKKRGSTKASRYVMG